MKKIKDIFNTQEFKKIAVILLLVFAFVLGFLLPRPVIIWPGQSLSVDQAAELISAYLISELGEQSEMTILSIDDEGALYKIKLEIDGQNFLSYLSKDGSLLFPTAIRLFVPGDQSLPLASRPKIELFAMALSPFGSLVQEQLIEAVSWFDDSVDFSFRYILFDQLGQENCLDQEERYCSPEGVADVEQAVRELCVAKYQPEKLIDFVLASNQLIDPEDYNSLLNHQENIENVILDLDIDLDQLDECFQQEAFELLEQELVRQNQKYRVMRPGNYIDAFGEYQTEAVIGCNDSCLLINEMIYGQSQELHYLMAEDYREIICSSFSKRSEPEICRVSFQEEEVSDQVTNGAVEDL
jgi:hypothetical protein